MSTRHLEISTMTFSFVLLNGILLSETTECTVPSANEPAYW